MQLITRSITSFIKYKVENSDSTGALLGLSGGIDSTVVCYLARKSLGSDKLMCIIMPEKEITPQSDIDDALEICSLLNIQNKLIYIDEVKKTFTDILGKDNDKILVGNLVARIRMCILYYFAGLTKKLVLGTSNKTELLTGYFTKYGDGASDLLPIGDLYKTQVKKIAYSLDIPLKIIEKKSSARLWKNQNTEEELGLPFEIIDYILSSTQKNTINKTSDYDLILKDVKKLFPKISIQQIMKILLLKEKNSHKLLFPELCILNIKEDIGV